MAETKELLQNRVRRHFIQQYGFINEENRIVQSIISGYSDGVIREYLSGSDDQMWILIAEANPLLTLQAQPSGLLPSLQPPALHQLTSSRYIMPPSQPSDGSYHGMHAPNPQEHQLQWPRYTTPPFQPNYRGYHGMHAPNRPIGQTGDFQSLNVGPSVFHGSGVPRVHNQMQGQCITPPFQPNYRGYHGMHAPNRPIGQTGDFQSLNAGPSVIGYPPSSSKGLNDAVSGSNEIFITFSAVSKFTEEDIQNYFKNYGPVSSVQIPHREKRTFGFVRFLYTETVRMVLSEDRVHFIGGEKVIVQKYIERDNQRVFTSAMWSG